MRFAVLVLVVSALSACQLVLDPGEIRPPDDRTDAGAPDGCVPLTCAEAGKECGAFADGCGGQAICLGACEAPETCGGGGQANFCGRAEICTPSGWCWENPLPQGEDLSSAFGFSGADAWAVGAGGSALRWDGVTWRRVETPTRAPLLAVWGAAPDDVWFGSSSGLLRWDGHTVQAVPGSSGAVAIWGASAGEAWACGASGTALRWDGQGWGDAGAPVGSSKLLAVSGSGARDVWFAGTSGLLLRWDGSWRSFPAGTQADLRALWVRSPSEAWAVGEGGTIRRWDGQGWGPAASPVSVDLVAIWGSESGEVWAMGAGGVVLRWDGSVWAVVPAPERPGLTAGALWGSGADDIWAVGSLGSMSRFDGRAWTSFSTGETRQLSAMWGSSPEVLWAVGSPGTPVILSRTSRGSWVAVPTKAQGGLTSVHGSSATDAWAVGERGESLHWDGASWKRLAKGTSVDLHAVWALSGGAAWAVGDGGYIGAFEADRWKPEASPTSEPLLGLWGSSYIEIWAVGAKGTVLKRSGGWTPAGPALDPSCMVVSVWWSSPSERWIGSADESCAFFRYTGSWSRFGIPPGSRTPSLPLRPWGRASNDVWAPRASQPPLRYDGKAWSEVDLGLTRAILGGWAGPANTWVAGEGGAVLRR